MSQARTRLEVDLGALAHNVSEICKRVSPCRVIAVLKANAYGTGVIRALETVRRAGVSRIAVADVTEAQEIAAAGLPVQILGTLFPEEVPEVVEAGFIAPVTGFESARVLSREALRQKRSVRCQIKVDTGMGRFGMDSDDACQEIREIFTLPGLEITGLYSHFSSASTPDNEFTGNQLARFKKLHSQLVQNGMTFEDVHIAASNGIGFYPDSCSAPFTMTRCGIIMYGCEKDHLDNCNWLKPVLSLKSRLLAVRQMKAGSYIGYGHTYQLPEDSLIGVIPAGYADGIPLAISNRGYVIVRGRLCPVVGRVCMDCTHILLNHLPEASAGDEVTFFGKDGQSEVSVCDWAELKDTHAHDILCSIGHRVERCYV